MGESVLIGIGGFTENSAKAKRRRSSELSNCQVDMAGFFKKIFNHFGLFKDGGDTQSVGKTPAGFSVRVAAPTEKELNAPVVSECTPGAGGVQGLRWYAEKLRMDEDGDVAQEFLGEVMPQPSVPGSGLRGSRNFEVKMQTRPVKLKGPVCTLDGNVHQSIDSSTGVHWS